MQEVLGGRRPHRGHGGFARLGEPSRTICRWSPRLDRTKSPTGSGEENSSASVQLTPGNAARGTAGSWIAARDYAVGFCRSRCQDRRKCGLARRRRQPDHRAASGETRRLRAPHRRSADALHRCRRALHVHDADSSAGAADNFQHLRIALQGRHVVDDFCAQFNSGLSDGGFGGVDRDRDRDLPANRLDDGHHT